MSKYLLKVVATEVAYHEDLNSNLLTGKDFPNNSYITKLNDSLVILNTEEETP